jgi:hypothetical protein
MTGFQFDGQKAQRSIFDSWQFSERNAALTRSVVPSILAQTVISKQLANPHITTPLFRLFHAWTEIICFNQKWIFR